MWYLTVPLVLSWSMLEARSAGCLVVGSDTAPVREVLRDGENGLMVDFFSPEAIAERVNEVLDHPNGMQAIRVAVRKTIVEGYEAKDSIARYERLIAYLCCGLAKGASAGAISG
jgi:glycosyltransferase involved in cell wall biosynthesis